MPTHPTLGVYHKGVVLKFHRLLQNIHWPTNLQQTEPQTNLPFLPTADMWGLQVEMPVCI